MIKTSHLDAMFAPTEAAMESTSTDQQKWTLAALKIVAKSHVSSIDSVYTAHPVVAAIGVEAAATTINGSALWTALQTVLSSILPTGGFLAQAFPILLGLLQVFLPATLAI